MLLNIVMLCTCCALLQSSSLIGIYNALCRYGGWVVDGFPLTRENWAAMIENNLLPDFVLNLEDGQAQQDYLLRRIIELHELQAETTDKADTLKEDEDINVRSLKYKAFLCAEILNV